MIVKDKTCIVFDVETLKNCFTCALLNTETGEIVVYEVSERKNEIQQIINIFKNNKQNIFVGYNNIHFDNIIIHYCLDYFNSNTDVNIITESLFELARNITESDDGFGPKQSQYHNSYESIDLLTMLYSKALRVSLKVMEVTMHFKNVQEMQTDWTKPIAIDKIDELIAYNINDVEATTQLLNNSKDEIALRLDIEKEYGTECLSKDGMKIGVTILEHKICEKMNISLQELRKMRSPCTKINLNDVILPQIRFKSQEFSEILDDMKRQVISDGRGVLTYEKIYNNLKYSVGIGGLHSLNKAEIITPKNDELLIDCDVASMYPALIIEYGFVPKHLGNEFLETYIQIRNERVEAKRNKQKLKDTTLKLALNGVTGNMGNEFSWMYDPFAVLQIRINGQLLLLMLAEMLTLIGCKVVSANTDGLTTIVPKNIENRYYETCQEWQSQTRLVLEFVEYEKLIIKAVNDYIAIKKGIHEQDLQTQIKDYIKRKGIFVEEVVPGRGLSPRIIPIALRNYFIYGIPVEKSIKACEDIKLFLMSEKTGKQWTVEYGGEQVQKINRFYVSTYGAYLDKWKVINKKEDLYPNTEYFCGFRRELEDWEIQEKEQSKVFNKNDQQISYTRMCSKPVIILNKFDNKYIDERNIDYSYYISECRKIIEEIEPRQLSLF